MVGCEAEKLTFKGPDIKVLATMVVLDQPDQA
jgi:hypothetical protein